MSRRAVDALNQIRERHRFMKGLFAWIGYSQEVLSPRARTLAHEMELLEALELRARGDHFVHDRPSRSRSYLGFSVTAMGAFLYAAFVIFKKVFLGGHGARLPILHAVRSLSWVGVQLMVSHGVIGEYLGRSSTRRRTGPLLLKAYHPARPPKRGNE